MQVLPQPFIFLIVLHEFSQCVCYSSAFGATSSIRRSCRKLACQIKHPAALPVFFDSPGLAVCGALGWCVTDEIRQIGLAADVVNLASVFKFRRDSLLADAFIAGIDSQNRFI